MDPDLQSQAQMNKEIDMQLRMDHKRLKSETKVTAGSSTASHRLT